MLLDTCAAIWSSAGSLSATAERRVADSDASGFALMVSPITAWEIGMLVAKGRVALMLDPGKWMDRLIEAGVVLAPMPPDVLIAASFLPAGQALRDPADRIVAATARTFGFEVMTRDKPLLDYAAAGHMHAFAC